MTHREFPSDEDIINCLRTNYAIEADRITALLDGADINALRYKVETQNGSYFVKITKGFCKNSTSTILDLFATHQIKEIVYPIKPIASEATFHFSTTIYPFIEAVNGFCQKLSQKQWMTLGRALRNIHDLCVPSSLIEHIRKETYCPKWRQIVRSFYHCFSDKAANHDPISIKFLNFMLEHHQIIQRLVDRAEELSNRIKNEPLEFVLCHSDIHAGNVLINKSGEIFIVDWDNPIMAPKERDLMFVGGGVANVWNDPEEEVFFYKGYGETKINNTVLSYYRHERIVQDIAEYAEELFFSNRSQPNREEMHRQFVSMFDPQGVVEIAFKTDHHD